MVDWTELRVAKLKLLHKEGLAAAGIAKKLEALVQASSAKAHPRMPAQPPPRSPDPIVVPPPTLPRNLGVPEPSGRELFELRAGQCRFPLGDDRPARLFCGAPTVGTCSWCEYHQRIVFPSLAPPKQRSRRPNPHEDNRAVERPTKLSGGPRTMGKTSSPREEKRLFT